LVMLVPGGAEVKRRAEPASSTADQRSGQH
jgi:hypothetical protein